jgi:ribosomal protein S12 methylthiotransferase
MPARSCLPRPVPRFLKYFIQRQYKTGHKGFYIMPVVALQNLGCSKNQIDGERMLAHLCRSGFTATQDFREADIIIVNTCAFIREATQEAIHEILHMAVYKKKGRCKTLAVAGCFSQRFGAEAQNDMPEVDLWLGLQDWPQQLKRRFHTPASPSFERQLFPPYATQYLKIAEGCSHRCSFCAIPAIRGPFESRPEADIIAEARWLESHCVKECILVSQDTSDYGKDRGRRSLVRLLEKLLSTTRFPWIRLMYLHPQRVDDELLRLVARESRVLPYFDIPLQHISDEILLSMKRRPLSKGVHGLIERIRTIVPGSAIRTTFVVGYPGETARHFRELLTFVEWARFERCGVFPFSPEPGTAAFAMKKRPGNPLVASRCDELMAVQGGISREICASRVGATLDVIVDGRAKLGWSARSAWDAPDVDGTVLITKGKPSVGSIIPVTITGSREYDLVGTIGEGGAGR